MADDILHAFLARLADWTPPPGKTRDELERELRQQWGGSTLYLKKKDPPERRQMALGTGSPPEPDSLMPALTLASACAPATGWPSAAGVAAKRFAILA
ncbi:MAG: hypothetical protein IPH55_19905 [Betaproteobacteria bacterium]|nr:hypothetical protein [Betaproteobacteria bacterium]